ncbi:MAG: mechanosensitive ion channel family protein [Sphaerochaetaceae bacterium]|nr:mechanosensitive ion channel family protein [Sphaerochaetaceae bacterium]
MISTLDSFVANTGFDSVFVIDTKGNIVLANNYDTQHEEIGKIIKYNLIRTNSNPTGVFTPEQFKILTASENGWTGTTRTTIKNGTEFNPVIATTDLTDKAKYSGYYYSYPVLNADGTPTGYYLVAAANSSQINNDLQSLKSIQTLLNSIQINSSGFIFTLDPENGTFSFFKNSDGLILTDRDFRECGITDDILKDGYSGFQKIEGESYFCISRKYSSDVFSNEVLLVAATPDFELYRSRFTDVFWSTIAFVLVGSLILCYVILIMLGQVKEGTIFEDQIFLFKTKSGKEVFYNSTIGKKVIPLLIIGLLAIFGVSMISQTTSQLTTALKTSEARIKELDASVKKNTKAAETVTQFFDKQNLYKNQLLAEILKRSPELAFNYDMTDEAHYEYAKTKDNTIVLDDYGNPVFTGRNIPILQTLCDSFGLSSIYIFNDKGRVIATNTPWWNFELSNDPNAQSYAFRDVLINSDHLFQELQENEVLGELEQFIGSVYYYYTYNDNGITRFVSESEYKNGVLDENENIIVPSSEITRHRGLVQIGISYENKAEVLKMKSIDYALQSKNMSYKGVFMSFKDNESHDIIYSPFAHGVEIKTRSAMFSGSYNGYMTINEMDYFVSIRKIGDMFIGTAIPTNSLFAFRFRIAMATVLISLVSLLAILAFLMFSTNKENEIFKRIIEQNEEQEEELLKESKKARNIGSEILLNSKNINEWKTKTLEQKFASITEIYYSIIFLVVFISVMIVNNTNNHDSIFYYIIKGDIEHGANIFVFSRCVIIFIIVISGAKVLQKIINSLTANIGARAETVGHLLESVLQYGGALVALFYSLYLFGLKPASLLASAGIISIVIGLGAQSLMSDIIAGIFIVFEGEFRVGDIVSIEDFRGTVIKIGIRTTNIEDAYGNVKIFNNSAITKVTNMTNDVSFVHIEMAIEYGESLERVESVLKKEFPRIKRKLKAIIRGPFYKGVSCLGDNSVNLLIVAQCEESDRFQLTRDLNRELYLVFNKNDINVPFPQVTVSYLNEKETKGTTAKEKKEAEKFIEEQKEASAEVDIATDN